MDLQDLNLSVRAYNCLKRAGYTTLEEVAAAPREKIMRVRNIGRRSFEEVERALAEHDMQVFTIHTILAVALMILWEEHNFRHAALNRFAKRFNVYADALLSGSINWEDILDCLREECDIYLDKEEFFRDTRKRD